MVIWTPELEGQWDEEGRTRGNLMSAVSEMCNAFQVWGGDQRTFTRCAEDA